MTETIATLDEYQELAASLRRNTTQNGWEELNGKIGADEGFEVFMQHGDVMAVLAPSSFWTPERIQSMKPPARFGMAEEIGDVLWFASDTAQRSNISLTDAVASALHRHNISAEPHTTFTQLGQLAQTHASQLTVTTTLGFFGRETRPEPHTVSLHENPYLIYGRTILRTIKSINPDLTCIGQRRAIDSETPLPIAEAVGELIIATAFVSEERLEVPVSLIAQYNIEKLQDRALRGKGKLPPAKWFAKHLKK